MRAGRPLGTISGSKLLEVVVFNYQSENSRLLETIRKNKQTRAASLAS